MKIGLGHKIAAFTSALVFLIGAGLFSVMVYQEQVIIHDLRMQETHDHTKRISAQVEDHLYNLDIRELRRVAANILQAGGIDRLMILDEEGRLLTDGSDKPALRNKVPQFPYIQNLIHEKNNMPSMAMDGMHHWTGVAVISGDDTLLGYVVLNFSQARLDANLNANLINQLIVLIPALFLGVLASFFLGRKLARPLVAVSEVAEKIGNGDWDAVIDVASQDEVGDLARSINAMALNLSQTAVSRDKLENIVEEKTKELLWHQEELEVLVNERTQKLEESEERFRGFAESSSDWFWETDENLRTSFLSDRFEAATRLNASDVLGKTRRELTAPNALQKDPEKWQRHFDDLDSRRSFRNFEYELPAAADGNVINVSVSGVPVFDEQGVFKGYRGSGEDTTERNVTEQELRQSERKFRSIVETTAEGYWLIDSTTKETIEVNESLCRMLGYREDELLGKTPMDLVDDENAKIFKNSISQISTTDHRTYDIVMMKKDGSPLPAHIEAATIHNEDGSPRASCAFVMDISERIKTQDELRKAMEDADQANQAKSEFLASMSHELRTPLNGILGFAQLLEYDPGVPLHEKQKDKTDQIIKSGNHLLELIDQVLELSKIEAGKITVSLENLSISAVLDECVPLIITMAEKRQINLITHHEDCADAVVRADHTRLKQVFLNLMSNAVKYNREGGTITIAATVVKAGTIRIAVADTGFGIAAESFDSLFQPFERLGHESSEIEGTGIGLTITRELVRLMGGEIGFDSEVGKGSTFWVDIPEAMNVSQSSQPDVRDEEDGFALTVPVGDETKTYVALYIEDNPANLMLMEQVFEMIPNLELISTHTAELGIELARTHHPDIILMDINLPGMNGIEALGELHKLKETRDIPVLAVSAAAMPHQITEGLEKGFKAYVTKPIQVETLLSTVREILDAS